MATEGFITGTVAHPFWSERAGTWLPMGELRFGEALVTTSGATVRVVEVEAVDLVVPTTTYNLTVEGWHTYFVAGKGATTGCGVWVHNTQQRACDFNLNAERSAFRSRPDMSRFKTGGELAGLKPNQKFLLGANDNQLVRPALDNIDSSSVVPKGYDMTGKFWQGHVSFELKGTGKRISFTNGFPDFTDHLYKRPPGSSGSSEVWVNCTRDSGKDISAAWRDSGFTAIEKDALKNDWVWHHSIDLQNNQVKMQLVPKTIHNAAKGGATHTGGFAVYDWLLQNGITF